MYEILNSAELICLMRYVSIPSTSTAECMVAANQSCKKAGVWIGNGNTEKAQLSFVNLNTDGHTCEVCVKVVIYYNFVGTQMCFKLHLNSRILLLDSSALRDLGKKKDFL